MSVKQFNRKASLILAQGNQGLDLSDLHFRFKTTQADVESPNACEIRVYNLRQETVRQIRGEFDRVILQAGYEGNLGVIFDGTIKQFRVGRENATDTYLDILAADGDLGYNFGVCSRTLAAGSTSQDRIKAAIEAMGPFNVREGKLLTPTGGILPRGKVLFGMARSVLRNECATQGASWSIRNGEINVIPLKSYLPGEQVDLTALSGLIGLPEQTIDGLKAQCLLNPRLAVGGTVRIDNKSINQTLQQNPNAAPVPYNQYTGLQLLAKTTNDGIYRVYVVEHEGDTRGLPWYSNLVCLAVDSSTQEVISNG